MNILGRLICAMTRKHKRGKKVGAVLSGNTMLINGVQVAAGQGLYECPRCFARWTRKVKIK